MIEIYFMLRHTPFWGVPLIILGVEFAYVLWLRKKVKAAMLALCFAIFGFSMTSFYFWAGGPDKSVAFVKKMQRDHN